MENTNSTTNVKIGKYFPVICYTFAMFAMLYILIQLGVASAVTGTTIVMSFKFSMFLIIPMVASIISSVFFTKRAGTSKRYLVIFNMHNIAMAILLIIIWVSGISIGPDGTVAATGTVVNIISWLLLIVYFIAPLIAIAISIELTKNSDKESSKNLYVFLYWQISSIIMLFPYFLGYGAVLASYISK